MTSDAAGERIARTLTVCRMDVYAHAGGERTLVAAGQQTVIAARA